LEWPAGYGRQGCPFTYGENWRTGVLGIWLAGQAGEFPGIDEITHQVESYQANNDGENNKSRHQAQGKTILEYGFAVSL
jgi:hypothetical protein